MQVDALLDPSTRSTPIWAAELYSRKDCEVSWLWHGYLARGEVTLLTSQWKAGKTTLLSILLDRLGRGEPTAGLETARTKAVVISEESNAQWSRRLQRFPVWDHACFLCRPFAATPDPAQWRALIELIDRLRRESGVELVVIDTLANFLPRGTENLADKVMDALRPLEQLTKEGMAVLLLHHPRKGESLAGQAARGSGALCAYADILMEMHWPLRQRPEDRRRRLCAWSRHEATPRDRMIELLEDGRDYRVLVDLEGEEEFEQGWAMVRDVLTVAEKRLTRKQILAAWPDTHRPSEATLWRWLERAKSLLRVQEDGQGGRHDPHRYWLPGRDVPVIADPLELLELV